MVIKTTTQQTPGQPGQPQPGQPGHPAEEPKKEGEEKKEEPKKPSVGERKKAMEERFGKPFDEILVDAVDSAFGATPVKTDEEKKKEKEKKEEKEKAQKELEAMPGYPNLPSEEDLKGLGPHPPGYVAPYTSLPGAGAPHPEQVMPVYHQQVAGAAAEEKGVTGGTRNPV
jgi:hypothetical protein